MRGHEAGGVTFGQSTGPSAHGAGAIAFGQAAGPSVIEANAVTFAPTPLPFFRVVEVIGSSTFTFLREMIDTVKAGSWSLPVQTEVWGNTGNNWYSTKAPDLWDYDLLICKLAANSTEAAFLRAQCDEAECSFIVGPPYFAENNSNSSKAGGGVAADFGIVTSTAGYFVGTNFSGSGCYYTAFSTHPIHSFPSTLSRQLYNDEEAVGLSTDTLFAGTGFGWHTSTQDSLFPSTARHYAMIALPEGTTDFSTGGIIRRRSMLWAGGYDYVANVDSVQLMEDAIYWMLSTGPLIPFVGTLWGPRDVTIDVGGFRHLSTARTHAYTRYQIDVSTGDWSIPVLETGWSTNLYTYNATGFSPGVDYKVRAQFQDDLGGESRWSAGLSEVSLPVSAEAGMRVEFIGSTGGVLQTLEYWTNSAAYTERVVEEIPPYAGAVSARLTPIKQGTADKGVCAKEVYVESGAIAAGYHPAPFFPARDDDTLVPPSWLNLGASTSTGVAVDLGAARHQKVTMAHNVTFSFTGYTAGGRYLLLCEQDGTGSRTGSFTGVEWPGGTAPTLTTTTGAKDIIVLDAESTAILHGAFRLDSK